MYSYNGLLEDSWSKARSAYDNVYNRYFPKEVILTTDTVDGKVARVCVNADAEYTMQNQRKLIYMVAAPVIVLGGYTLRRKKKDRLLGNALIAIGAYCGWYHYRSHQKVQRLLSAAVVSPAATVPVKVEDAAQSAAAEAVVAKAEEVATKAAIVDAAVSQAQAVEAAAAAPVTIAAEDAAEVGYYGMGMHPKFDHGLDVLPPYRRGGSADPRSGLGFTLGRKKPKKGTYAYRRARANFLNA
jgi:hypothetical protein